VPERRISREGEGGRDRRIIERFHDPRVFQAFKSLRALVWLLAGIFLVAGLYSSLVGVIFNPTNIGRDVFLAVMAFLYFSLLLNFASRISYYLTNESLDSFAAVAERQVHMVIVLLVFVLLGVLLPLIF
jgi:hypothetical protein